MLFPSVCGGAVGMLIWMPSVVWSAIGIIAARLDTVNVPELWH